MTSNRITSWQLKRKPSLDSLSHLLTALPCFPFWRLKDGWVQMKDSLWLTCHAHRTFPVRFIFILFGGQRKCGAWRVTLTDERCPEMRRRMLFFFLFFLPSHLSSHRSLWNVRSLLDTGWAVWIFFWAAVMNNKNNIRSCPEEGFKELIPRCLTAAKKIN